MWGEEARPKPDSLPLLNSRHHGIPRGQWKSLRPSTSESCDCPLTSLRRILCQLEPMIEQLARRKLLALTLYARACDNSSLHGAITHLGEEEAFRATRSKWRDGSSHETRFAESVDKGLHDFLDDLRRDSEAFLSERNIASEAQCEMLDDAEWYALRFLLEELETHPETATENSP